MFVMAWWSEVLVAQLLADSLGPSELARQAPLSIGFPGKKTVVGSHSFLQGILPTQESNPGLLHCQWILYHLSHQGSLFVMRKQAIWEESVPLLGARDCLFLSYLGYWVSVT